MTVFRVTETENGRFQFGGFGVAVGGKDRSRPFVIVVKDRYGRVVARSKTVTAVGLGIADRGRVDYDKNGFHQTDFFVRDGTGAPQPSSAIARRIDWE